MHSTAQAATKIETNRKTTVFQKDSFWLAKGLVLECKRTRFGMQKDPFWSAKGVLLEVYSLKLKLLTRIFHFSLLPFHLQTIGFFTFHFSLFTYHGYYNPAIVKPAITMLTIDISLMRMLSDGPEVSLNGSPTVSPTIVALWFSLPLPP